MHICVDVCSLHMGGGYVRIMSHCPIQTSLDQFTVVLDIYSVNTLVCVVERREGRRGLREGAVK